MGRDGPPPSAWLAAGFVVLPPLAGVAAVGLAGEWIAAGFVAVWLVAVLVPVGFLIGDGPAGWEATWGLLVPNAGFAAGVAVVLATEAGLSHRAGLLAAGGWLGMTVLLLLWPGTRAWCGRLPPDPGAYDGA